MKTILNQFLVSGTFDIAANLEPVEDARGNIVAYKNDSGDVFKMIVAIEVENPDGTLSYITKENEMAEAGLECLNYEKVEFYPGEEVKD